MVHLSRVIQLKNNDPSLLCRAAYNALQPQLRNACRLGTELV